MTVKVINRSTYEAQDGSGNSDTLRIVDFASDDPSSYLRMSGLTEDEAAEYEDGKEYTVVLEEAE